MRFSKKLLFNVLRAITIKFILYAILLFLSILIFWSLRQINKSTLIFDQLLIICGLTGILCWLLLKSNFQIIFKTQVIWQDIGIGALLTFLILTSTVVNIDRSRSFYVLGWVYKNEVRESQNHIDLSTVTSSEKLNLNGVVQRIKEQETRGLLIKNGTVENLSTTGKVVYRISSIFARAFHLEGWVKNNH